MNDWQNVAHIDINLSDNTKLYLNWSHQSEGTEQPMEPGCSREIGQFPSLLRDQLQQVGSLHAERGAYLYADVDCASPRRLYALEPARSARAPECDYARGLELSAEGRLWQRSGATHQQWLEQGQQRHSRIG